MMNLRTIFSASAAATLLVVGPGFALAGPNGHLSGDVVGSANGAAQVADGGVNGDAIASSSTSLEAGFDAGDAPEMPSVPDAPEAPAMPEAPEAPQAPSAPDAPEAPQGPSASAPGTPTVDAPGLPGAPELPQGPSAPEAPKGDKGAMEKGNGGIRIEGKFHASGSVRGGNPPQADSDADGSGSAEVGGHKVSTP